MKKLINPIFAASEANTYEIPVTWKVETVLLVTNNSLKEAIQEVNRLEYKLPEGNYVADSFKIDYDRLEE